MCCWLHANAWNSGVVQCKADIVCAACEQGAVHKASGHAGCYLSRARKSGSHGPLFSTGPLKLSSNARRLARVPKSETPSLSLSNNNTEEVMHRQCKRLSIVATPMKRRSDAQGDLSTYMPHIRTYTAYLLDVAVLSQVACEHRAIAERMGVQYGKACLTASLFKTQRRSQFAVPS